MQMDDMILVSIDDHMIEPPDMFENHVPEKWKDPVPKVVRNDAGRRRVGVPGREDLDAVRHGRHRRLAEGGVGLQPRHLLRAAARLLRRPRAGARTWTPTAILASMNFPTMAGFNARTFTEAGDKELALVIAAGLQRLGHRRVGRQLPRTGSSPWASSRCGTSTSRSRRSTASARRAAGRSASSRPRTCRASRASCPGTGTRCSAAICDENMVLSLHIGAGLRGDPPPAGGPDRPPHGAGLPDQRHHRAGPALRPDPAPVPRPAGRAVRGRHRLDPVLLRPDRPPLREPDAGCTAATTSAASCRPRCSASTSSPASSPTRPGCCCATASASTSSPGSATTPTPTPRGPSRPSSPGRSSRTPACTDEEIHKITWENACRFFDWDPFAHTAREDATVGALRARARPPTSTSPACRGPSGSSRTRPPASASA